MLTSLNCYLMEVIFLHYSGYNVLSNHKVDCEHYFSNNKTVSPSDEALPIGNVGSVIHEWKNVRERNVMLKMIYNF